jgi:type I restriction enzyme S subunit
MDRPFVSEGFKVARVTDQDLPALLLQRVGRFIPRGETDSEYVWALVHSDVLKTHLLRSQQGTDLPHISRFDIENAPIPRHSPAQIRAVTDAHRRAEVLANSLRARLDETQRLKKALLQEFVDGVH